MPTQTKHPLLQILHIFSQVKVTAAVRLNCLPYTHMGSLYPQFLKFMLWPWLVILIPLFYAWLANCFTSFSSDITPDRKPYLNTLLPRDRFPDQHPVLISVTTLSHIVLFFFTQLTGGQVPLQSTWHEQGADKKGGACVLEAENTTWASRNVGSVLRTGQG